MDFMPMSSIEKKPNTGTYRCTDWVATEKVHGSSFQFYTRDGSSVLVGSRRRPLDSNGSFLHCQLQNLLGDYHHYVLRAWHVVNSEDKWAPYRDLLSHSNDDDEDENGGDNDDDDNNDDNELDSQTEVEDKERLVTQSEDLGAKEKVVTACDVRVYGELYGGGGINKSIKDAVQKEIIYCDDFRFYVFGLTINNNWLTISELGNLCEKAGFPYYAKPVCEPMATVEELQDWLVATGFIHSKSSLTEKTDDDKTAIEGVVMTPLSKPDFKLHAVKFLAPSFHDVRAITLSKGAKTIVNYCTKQRYHSVISKLDTHERENTQFVVDMFIADIAKESGKNSSVAMRATWAAHVTQWLREDEYFVDGSSKRWIDPLAKNNPMARRAPDEEYIRIQKEKARILKEQKAKEDEEEECEDMGIGFFDS